MREGPMRAYFCLKRKGKGNKNLGISFFLIWFPKLHECRISCLSLGEVNRHFLHPTLSLALYLTYSSCLAASSLVKFWRVKTKELFEKSIRMTF